MWNWLGDILINLEPQTLFYINLEQQTTFWTADDILDEFRTVDFFYKNWNYKFSY